MSWQVGNPGYAVRRAPERSDQRRASCCYRPQLTAQHSTAVAAIQKRKHSYRDVKHTKTQTEQLCRTTNRQKTNNETKQMKAKVPKLAQQAEDKRHVELIDALDFSMCQELTRCLHIHIHTYTQTDTPAQFHIIDIFQSGAGNTTRSAETEPTTQRVHTNQPALPTPPPKNQEVSQ